MGWSKCFGELEMLLLLVMMVMMMMTMTTTMWLVHCNLETLLYVELMRQYTKGKSLCSKKVSHDK